MNELVFIKNDQVVTDSVTVARVFEKRHDSVLRDIRNLECTDEFHLHNFVEIDYLDDGNRKYKKFLIKRDGLSFLIFGYTGKKSAEYKEMYIKAFNQMEEELKQPKLLTEREQLVAAMQLSIESDKRIDKVEGQVNKLAKKFDDELTLNHGQAVSLNHAVKKRIETLWKDGVTGALETKGQLYSAIYSQMRRAFHAPGYRDVKRVDFNEAKKWVGAWRPL
ncbi:Rha family transcriptional regulator [Amphibacillus jilinensis]|uniref:Rha family transcriptional regulator n=1 Tax=Amphibacillus jilinensis TaxID=1216008 RepID=UPI0002E7DA68|nr:phage regulatory protein [Amphibacillus jilinensis]